MAGTTFHVLHYDTIGSTNDEVRRLAAEDAPHGIVVHADEQTAGRGRLARAWFSPPGNLYMSILLRLDLPPARLSELSFVTAVAVAEAVRGLLPQKAEVIVKWPNDVLVNGAKISGILLENADGVTVIGVGLNVLEAPPNNAYRTTTLAAAGGIATVDGARDLLLAELARLLDIWTADGFAPVRTAWLQRTYPPGTPLKVTIGSQILEGTFADMADDGALVLDTPAGPRRIVAGDVGVG